MHAHIYIYFFSLLVPWSEILWLDMEPSDAGLKVLNAIVSLQPELISAFALRDRERFAFSYTLTYRHIYTLLSLEMRDFWHVAFHFIFILTIAMCFSHSPIFFLLNIHTYIHIHIHIHIHTHIH